MKGCTSVKNKGVSSFLENIFVFVELDVALIEFLALFFLENIVVMDISK
jgi:hypothetical protein